MPESLAERSRLSARQAAKAEPAFARGFMFDFYDGPETGVAETSAGEAFRYEAIGESRYRRFRAYSLHRLAGDPPFLWSDEPGFSWMTGDQWEAARRQTTVERYVGISDLWLNGLVVSRLTPEALPPTGFAEAHRFLRAKFVSVENRMFD